MFELLHDLAYDHEGRDRSIYKRAAQIILKQPPPQMENRRVVDISKYTYVELRRSLQALESWTDADIHRPNCILYAGYGQPELRRHMTELVFVAREPEAEEMFRGHRLLGLHCDHNQRTDVAMCECGWTSNELMTVGAAFDSWATHLRSKKSLDNG